MPSFERVADRYMQASTNAGHAVEAYASSSKALHLRDEAAKAIINRPGQMKLGPVQAVLEEILELGFGLTKQDAAKEAKNLARKFPKPLR